MSWEATVITIARRFPPPGADVWTTVFDRVPFVAVTGALAAVALFNRRWSLAVAGTIGCAGAVLAAEHIFKPLLADSYPSGHVTAAAACATFAWCIGTKRRFVSLAVFVIPVAVAWALVARQIHYPADVIGGLLLGPLAVGIAVLLITQSTSFVASVRRETIYSP